MDRIFYKHRAHTRVLFDDIIIYSKSLEEHKSHLKAVFQELGDNKLYVNGKKSEFFLQEIHYLGHIIPKDGIRKKVDAIKNGLNHGISMNSETSLEFAFTIGDS